MLLAVRLQSHHREMFIDMAKREAEGSHIMLGAQNVDLNLSAHSTVKPLLLC
ncbi:hypothetical protein ACNKHM_11150 [Shigella sonnei]